MMKDYKPPHSLKTYRRRIKTLTKDHAGHVFIIFSSEFKHRSYDTYFPFRQNNNFAYLCGYPEESSALVIRTYPKLEVHLYVSAKDPLKELWEGERIGVNKAQENFYADHVHLIDDFSNQLEDILKGHEELFVDLENQEQKGKYEKMIAPTLERVRAQKKIKTIFPSKLSDLNQEISKLRLVKDKEEISFMRKSCEIAVKAHKCAMAFARPGVTEGQVQAAMEYIYKMHFATGPAYDSIVASGNNANTLHYIKNNAQLKDGELLLIDAGCEYNYYASDISRTFPINGKFTTKQKDIYQIVLDAQEYAIGIVRPGITLGEIHEKTGRKLIKGLVDLGIYSKNKKNIWDDNSYREFYPHGTSHWLGMDVHDPCPYLKVPSQIKPKNKTKELKEIVLEEGMVFTVEPGLYFADNKKGVGKWGGIGIRIEDDILVTKNGHENLSVGAPKKIKEVEEACSQDYRDYLIC